jgi:hypothetical protein
MAVTASTKEKQFAKAALRVSAPGWWCDLPLYAVLQYARYACAWTRPQQLSQPAYPNLSKLWCVSDGWGLHLRWEGPGG